LLIYSTYSEVLFVESSFYNHCYSVPLFPTKLASARDLESSGLSRPSPLLCLFVYTF